MHHRNMYDYKEYYVIFNSLDQLSNGLMLHPRSDLWNDVCATVHACVRALVRAYIRFSSENSTDHHFCRIDSQLGYSMYDLKQVQIW